MAVTVKMDIPATSEQYDEVNSKMGVESDAPDGLILHTAAQAGDGMKIIDVWESADQFNRFAQEKLGPAVTAVMGEMPEGAGPSPEITELHNVIKP